MTISKKAFTGILSLTVAVLLTACSGNTNQGGNTNSSQNTQSQTSQASSNAGQTSNIDGRYQATDHDGDQHVLEINGRTGAWTETEVEGSKEIKQVQVDTASQRLIVDELDDDPDTLTFSKQ